MKKISSILSLVLLFITFSLVIIMLFTRLQGKTPQLFGYQILRISSTSMEPKLKVGDIIISKSVKDVTALKLGDVITYKGKVGSYSDKTITHEVTQEPYKENGKYYLQTRGIANSYPDPEISEDQVIGKMVCTLSIFSVAYNFFITPWGLAVILGFLTLVFINEVFALRQIAKSSNDKTSDCLSEESAENAVHTTDSTDCQE